MSTELPSSTKHLATSWSQMATMMTSGNSLLDTSFTFSLPVNPNNSLFLPAFMGAPCVSITLTIFLLAVPLGVSFGAENPPIIAPRKILPPSFLAPLLLYASVYSLLAVLRVFLGGDLPNSEDRLFFGDFLDFPPICKQDPLDVQMNYIKDHFASTDTTINLEDVPETMYGGVLPVAKSRKTKRKAISKDDYLEDASEQSSKKAKKAKKEKASSEVNVGSDVPTIQEEVQDLDAERVLNKRTRSGKEVASSQIAHDQPSIPKKKRKQAIRKLKVTTDAAEEEEEIDAATNLVTREVRKKKVEDAATLQKALKLAKQIKIPASSIAREDVGANAQEVTRDAEVVQEMVAIEAGSLLDIGAGVLEAVIPKASEGILNSQHTDNLIIVESGSTLSISSQSTSSTFSSDLDDVPLGQIYITIHKGLSPSTKTHKNPGVNYNTFEPMIPSVDERIGSLSQMRIDVCKGDSGVLQAFHHRQHAD
ncbi:transmembrane protein, putative [Medicago truncatula]|uniref:Transmembrane protein, putative n=1 Tax=Medicago truncatula TaxID=3880 RepID=A0A072TYP5_MEDTR|nr:transmembrane protein, putative [Medicago truncatula]